MVYDEYNYLFNVVKSKSELIERFGDMPEKEATAWLNAYTIAAYNKPVLIIRLEHYTTISDRSKLEAVKASLTVKDSNSPEAVDGMKIEGKWFGDYANDYSVTWKQTSKIVDFVLDIYNQNVNEPKNRIKQLEFKGGKASKYTYPSFKAGKDSGVGIEEIEISVRLWGSLGSYNNPVGPKRFNYTTPSL